MIYRSSPVGLRPVVEALYTWYLKSLFWEGIPIPFELISLVDEFHNLDEEATAWLANAISNHLQKSS